MKTIITFLLCTLSVITYAQKDFTIKSLSKRYDKGVKSTSKMDYSKKQFIKKTICLKKNYNFQFNEMQEFLTAKEYFITYGEKPIDNDNTYSKVYQSSIQKSEFPKCYK